MVKLQKRFAYTYNDKDHYKHIVTIPEETIGRIGWKEGDELVFDIENNKIILSKQRGGKK